MTKRSDVTTRSLLFGSCVSAGLLISYVDGVSGLEIAKTALLASALFLAFLVSEAAMPKWRSMRRSRKRQ